jgi:hypothetical protein
VLVILELPRLFLLSLHSLTRLNGHSDFLASGRKNRKPPTASAGGGLVFPLSESFSSGSVSRAPIVTGNSNGTNSDHAGNPGDAHRVGAEETHDDIQSRSDGRAGVKNVCGFGRTGCFCRRNSCVPQT